MIAENFEIIIGHHSIYQSIKNNQRQCGKLFGTMDGWSKFQSSYPEISKVAKERGLTFTPSSHESFQQQIEKLFSQFDFQYTRPPGEILYLAPKRPPVQFSDLVAANPQLIIALDQITDIHNAAAIARTCAFYNSSSIILSRKGGFKLTPGCYRTASGALEFVDIYSVDSLVRALTILKKKSYRIIGFSENSDTKTDIKSEIEKHRNEKAPLCLVFGNEEKGISHAILRILDEVWPLQGDSTEIKSLNVSVATAIVLDRFLGKF
ncbi:MAG: RNA methyltransferase [Bacteriovoracaceae bacterium]|nr:RNA methyltransferase [Bacteriovoracaceae bacterium]